MRGWISTKPCLICWGCPIPGPGCFTDDARKTELRHFSGTPSSLIFCAAETTGTVILILLFSFMIGRILASERIPQDLTELVTNLIQNPLLILIAVLILDRQRALEERLAATPSSVPV